MTNRQSTELITPQDVRDDVLKPGDVLLTGQYRIDRFLSSGGFGITYLATDSLDRTVVIKECFPNAICCRMGQTVQVRTKTMAADFAALVRHFGYEARRLSKLSHPSIVGVHQVFEDKGTAYMALDFIEGRDLMHVIEHERESLTPNDIKTMLIRLLDAVAYIHENNVLHRDISPDNILIDKTGNPVLIDFGAAREVATNATRALSALHVVKDGYSPQEFYLADGSQDASSDLYSLAASFYHLITGTQPPNSQVRLAALAAEDPDPYKPIPPLSSGFDHFFLEAFDKALQIFPKHRLQSALEWIEVIDTVRRQKAMKARAEKDQEIDLAIKLLTEETNSAIAEDTKPQGKKVPAPKPEPKPAIALPRNERKRTNVQVESEASPRIAAPRNEIRKPRSTSAQNVDGLRESITPKRQRSLGPGAILAFIASRFGLARRKSDESWRSSS